MPLLSQKIREALTQATVYYLSYLPVSIRKEDVHITNLTTCRGLSRIKAGFDTLTRNDI